MNDRRSTATSTDDSLARLGRVAPRAAWRSLGERLFTTAMDQNLNQIAALIAQEAGTRRWPLSMLDLGCWDGANASRYLPEDAVRYGIEGNPIAARRAIRAGFQVTQADLNRSFPLADETFDVVTSNQVFEHLHDTDTFIAESRRVLRPGGLLLVSTENLASWHNIGSLLLGWQAFSLTNVTKHVAGVGNPLANLRGDGGLDAGWQHQRIFSHRGLKELLREHGFASVRVYGSGYYPLPSRFGRIDPRHAALIIVAGRKPQKVSADPGGGDGRLHAGSMTRRESCSCPARSAAT